MDAATISAVSGSAISIGTYTTLEVRGFVKHRRRLRTQAMADMARIDAKHQYTEPECAYCAAPVLSGEGWHEECEPRTMVDLGPTTPWIPEPEFVDTSWMDIVGIPFELWCSYGTCHGPNGYAFAPARLNSLTRRRDAGDFIEPVDLVKRSRRVPERRKQRTLLDSGVIAGEELRQVILANDRAVKQALSVPRPPLGESTPSAQAQTIRRALLPQAERNQNIVNPTGEQLQALFAGRLDADRWIIQHSGHGITWKLALYVPSRLDMLVGVCRRCGSALWFTFYDQSVEFRHVSIT